MCGVRCHVTLVPAKSCSPEPSRCFPAASPTSRGFGWARGSRAGGFRPSVPTPSAGCREQERYADGNNLRRGALITSARRETPANPSGPVASHLGHRKTNVVERRRACARVIEGGRCLMPRIANTAPAKSTVVTNQGAANSADQRDATSSRVDDLIQRGRNQGHLSLSELRTAFAQAGLTPAEAGPILRELTEAGVRLADEEPSLHAPKAARKATAPRGAGLKSTVSGKDGDSNAGTVRKATAPKVADAKVASADAVGEDAPAAAATEAEVAEVAVAEVAVAEGTVVVSTMAASTVAGTGPAKGTGTTRKPRGKAKAEAAPAPKAVAQGSGDDEDADFADDDLAELEAEATVFGDGVDLDDQTPAMGDSVHTYLKSIGRTSLLTAEQEVDLAKRIEAGLFAEHKLDSDPDLSPDFRHELELVAEDGRRAKAHMLEANLRLVVSVAKKYSDRGLSLLDVVQEGNLGLIRAVEKFDYTKGYKFSTYAMWWIRQAIQRGFADS